MIPAGIEPATFQFVAQHLYHCATMVPHKVKYILYICMYFREIWRLWIGVVLYLVEYFKY